MAEPPDEAALHEAALAHLARFAATEAGLLRVLHRKVQRWATRSRAEPHDPDTLAAQVRRAREAAGDVVRRLAAAGIVDDAAFARARATRLSRAGRSARVISAHLAARGVGAAITREATAEVAAEEYGAAILFARRRRLGPFGPSADGQAQAANRLKELGAFARAGFSRDLAVRVLRLSPAEAAEAAARLRQS